MPSQPNGYSRENSARTPSGMLGRQTPWNPSQPAIASHSSSSSAKRILVQQVGRALLEHTGADTVLDVVAAAALEHHGLDPQAVKQVRERQSGRPGSDDADLRPHRSKSAAWPWPTPTQSVARP